MTRSNQFQVRAFFREFPWLADLLEQTGYEGEVEKVNVQRIGPDFLDRIPLYRGVIGSLVGISDSEKIFLVDKDGKILEEPWQSLDITHNEAYQGNEEKKGESTGEALSHLEDPNSVMYAVCVHTGYRIQDHYSVGGYSVTVYKPPRGFTLKGWVEEQRRRAEQMLAAEVAGIDSEATLA